VNAADPADWASMTDAARERIRGMVRQTPVARVTQAFGESLESARVFLKLENLQETGSFKLRGAANKVPLLGPLEAERGIVAASNGNHGIAVAAAARPRGIAAEVYVSEKVSATIIARIEAYGAKTRRIGSDPLESEIAARRDATASGRVYISGYNDPDVVAGQGTIAAELLEQLNQIDAIYVAVGGGGLIGGIGAYLKARSPRTEVVGCWPENSRVLYESLRAGRIIEFPEAPTLSESTAGGLEPGSVTFALCQRVIDRGVLVSEEKILDAMRWAAERGWMVEGAAGVAIAACFQELQRIQGKTAVIVSCGGNPSPEVAARLAL
jgi:threonine dehydratase